MLSLGMGIDLYRLSVYALSVSPGVTPAKACARGKVFLGTPHCTVQPRSFVIRLGPAYPPNQSASQEPP